MFRCIPILRSKAPCGRILSTLECSYPRFIHSELLTHRDRERNSGSSRAIPWNTMMANITENPVMPLKWGSEQKGMIAGDEIPAPLATEAYKIWLEARDDAVKHANRLHNIGKSYNKRYPSLANPEYEDIRIHKSLPNRVTEPWMWITVVITSTEWNNLFRQRVHSDAEIHFQEIADMMKKEILRTDNIIELKNGEWHLPYVASVDNDNIGKAIINQALPTLSTDSFAYDVVQYAKRVSVARCARVSYVQHGSKGRDVIADCNLWERLRTGSTFGHWSPFGHQGEACDKLIRSGPFVGFKQFRKEFIDENVEG